MFSFRTTPLDEQEDIVLRSGKVAVLCNQAAWNPEKEEYLFESLYKKGNLVRVFYPEYGLFGENVSLKQTDAQMQYGAIGMDGVEFVSVKSNDSEEAIDLKYLEDINALVVEYQDTGSRYDSFTGLLYSLFGIIHRSKLPISIYILDRGNPCGRQVEGTVLNPALTDTFGLEGIPHRHGLTLGELANLFYSEIGAKFPLHIISYMVRSATQYMMPWSISPHEDVPGLFTSQFYCGMRMLYGTNISFGEGTTRPYELFGAPFFEKIMKNGDTERLSDPGIFLRKTKFTPRFGLYADTECWGFQMLPRPGAQYHSTAHSLRVLRYICENLPEADYSILPRMVGDPILFEYILGNVKWEDVKEHIKVEEQKWIRKAKRYMLYDEQLMRVKSLI